jgi:phosphoribosyl 1,2-cyclic phosphate phosphodiesterase
MATLTFLGTGTSMGVPTLGCECAVCHSARLPGSPNRRTRPSVMLEYDEPNPTGVDPKATTSRVVLIDTGPDFHAQAIRENISRVDAVLYTHSHADHILGMDDLRPLSFKNPGGIPLYADAHTADVIARVFEYTFRTVDRYPTSAHVNLQNLHDGPQNFHVFTTEFHKIPVIHGRNTISGFRLGSMAYLTDMSDVPEESFPLLEYLDILVLDALRRDPHPSHAHLDKSVNIVNKIAPKRAFFTHISHDLDHNSVNAELPPHVQLAHDGLKLNFDIDR